MSRIRVDVDSESETDENQPPLEPVARSGSGSVSACATTDFFDTFEMASGVLHGGSNEVKEPFTQLGSENRTQNVRNPVSGSRSDRTSAFKVPKINPNPVWDEHLDVWLADKAKGTKRKYLLGIRSLRVYVNDIRPEEISLAVLREYRAHIMEHAPERSRRDYLIPVRSFFVYLYEQQIIARNHGKALKIPPKPVTIGQERALTREEVQRIIDHAEGMDRYMFATIYYAGLRVDEVAQLTPDRVTRRGDRLMLTVYGKGAKTREIALGAKGSAILLEWINFQRIPAILFDISTRQIRRRLKKIAQRAGLSPHISPHWLRHAFATHAYDAGAQIVALSKVLGHASTKTTLQYIHCNTEQVGATLD